jgi:hypothetical protein
MCSMYIAENRASSKSVVSVHSTSTQDSLLSHTSDQGRYAEAGIAAPSIACVHVTVHGEDIAC